MDVTRQFLIRLVRALRIVWAAAPRYCTAACVLAVIGAACVAAQAVIMKLMVDQIVTAARPPHSGGTGDRLALLIACQLCIWLLGSLSSSLVDSVREVLGFRVNQRVQHLILEKCAQLDLAFYDNAGFYNKLENARNESSWQPAALVWALQGVVQQTLTLIGMLLLLGRLSVWLIPIMLVTAIPQVAVAAKFSRRRYHMMTDRAPERRMSRYMSLLLSTRETAQEVRAFRLAPLFLGRFSGLTQRFARENERLEMRRQKGEVPAIVVSLFGLSVAYTWAAVAAIAMSITIGDLAMYFRAAETVRSGLFSLFQQLAHIYESALFLGNLFEFLDLRCDSVQGAIRRPRRPFASRTRPALTGAPRIELRNVSFRYPGTQMWTIDGISLVIEPEERLLLVGPNGAGKSTLVKLLLRLYDPTQGQILVNQQDLMEFDPEEWRESCAVLFQDFVRYQLSVLESIHLGRSDRPLDIARSEAALDLACLGTVVRRLPQGGDTVLGRYFDGSVDLSVGEWQRLALGRTWYRGSPFVILDEPTAALDAETEHALLRTYQEFCEGRTTLLVSHRLSMAHLADRVAVLDRGILTEHGTHHDLVAGGGLYARMYTTQAMRYT